MIETITECVQPCNSIRGKGMSNQTNLGMLNATLELRYDIAEQGRKTGQTAKLDNVIVVDRLPVPLHISVKRFFSESLSAMYKLLKICTII